MDKSQKKEMVVVATLDGKYSLHRVLGGGTTSKVYLATRKADDQLVAVKIFRSEFLS